MPFSFALYEISSTWFVCFMLSVYSYEVLSEFVKTGATIWTVIIVAFCNDISYRCVDILQYFFMIPILWYVLIS